MACCFFFKQKTAYEMRISDWSSDVCSSDLLHPVQPLPSRPLPLPILRIARRPHLRSRHPARAWRPHDMGKCGAGLRALQPAQGRPPAGPGPYGEIGSASCRVRGCQYVWISVVGVTLKKQKRKTNKEKK